MKDYRLAGSTMSERLFINTQGTLSKIKCFVLIKFDDNLDKLFGITEYKDDIIRFHIFDYLSKIKLILKQY